MGFFIISMFSHSNVRFIPHHADTVNLCRATREKVPVDPAAKLCNLLVKDGFELWGAALSGVPLICHVAISCREGCVYPRLMVSPDPPRV